MTTLTYFLLFGLVGCFGEIVFTCGHAVVVSLQARQPIDWRLPAITYGWMFPIYGLSGLMYEPVYQAVHEYHWILRGLVYTVLIFMGEYAFGWVIKKAVGMSPWNYSHARWNIHGLIRFDYAPVWFISGLIVESVRAAIHAVTPVLLAM